MAEVWTIVLKAGQRDVLLVMADHANDEGLCWPGIPKIAWKVDKDRRTIQRTMRQLEESGLIEKVGRVAGGRGYTTLFQLRLDKGVKKSPFVAESGEWEESEGLTSGSTDVQFDSEVEGGETPPITSDESKGGETPPITERAASARGKGGADARKGDIAVPPEPPKNHQEPPSPPGGSTSDPVTTDQIMQRVIEPGALLPRRFKGHLARRIHMLLGEGKFDPKVITEAARRCVNHRRPDPALMDSLVVEVMNEKSGRSNGNGHRPFATPHADEYEGAIR